MSSGQAHGKKLARLWRAHGLQLINQHWRAYGAVLLASLPSGIFRGSDAEIHALAFGDLFPFVTEAHVEALLREFRILGSFCRWRDGAETFNCLVPIYGGGAPDRRIPRGAWKAHVAQIGVLRGESKPEKGDIEGGSSSTPPLVN